MHDNSYGLGTNGNLELIPQMGETSRELGGFFGQTWPSFDRERVLQLYVLSLTLSALGLCAGLVLAGFRIHQPAGLAVLAALAFAADYGSIRLSASAEVTIASLVCVFAAVVLGPLSGAVVATAGLLRDLPRRDTEQPILRWATWTSKRVLGTIAAGLTAGAVRGYSDRSFLWIFAAVTAAFVVETFVGEGLNCVAPAIRKTSPPLATLRASLAGDLVSVPLHVPMVSVLAYVYLTVS